MQPTTGPRKRVFTAPRISRSQPSTTSPFLPPSLTSLLSSCTERNPVLFALLGKQTELEKHARGSGMKRQQDGEVELSGSLSRGYTKLLKSSKAGITPPVCPNLGQRGQFLYLCLDQSLRAEVSGRRCDFEGGVSFQATKPHWEPTAEGSLPTAFPGAGVCVPHS